MIFVATCSEEIQNITQNYALSLSGRRNQSITLSPTIRNCYFLMEAKRGLTTLKVSWGKCIVKFIGCTQSIDEVN